MARHYKGRRGPDGCHVTVDGEPLHPHDDFRSPSSGEFEWGYEGEGPSRLALAILADHLGDPVKALSFQAQFRRDVIARIRADEWTLDSAEIDRALEQVADVPMTLSELMAKLRGG